MKYSFFRSFIWFVKLFILPRLIWECWKKIWKNVLKKHKHACIFLWQCTYLMSLKKVLVEMWLAHGQYMYKKSKGHSTTCWSNFENVIKQKMDINIILITLKNVSEMAPVIWTQFSFLAFEDLPKKWLIVCFQLKIWHCAKNKLYFLTPYEYPDLGQPKSI